MEDPFVFDTVNKRLVSNVTNANKVYFGTGALYIFSLMAYNRKYLRVGGDGVAAAAFAAASLPAAYSYARFFLDSADNEAARMNNANEWAS